MADDAFALSPISARASLPSEADYGAIRDAFRETARGRWFLDEYTRRNRNADTTQVLDAVARLEAKFAHTPPPAPVAALSAESIRAGVLEAIRPLIAEARTAAEAAIVTSKNPETIAAGRRAARIIRDISWSLRETGTDPRRCNVLDAQLLLLDAVHDHAETDTAAASISEVFDDLILRIADIAGSAAPPAPVARPEPVERVGANMPDAVAPPPIMPIAIVADEPPLPTADELAADEAMLNLIAMEMDAPETDEIDDFARDDSVVLTSHDPVASVAPMPVVAPMPMVAPSLPAVVAALPVETPPASLGAALIASGIVQSSRRDHDALAPFRRMSQIDKIAFFS